MTEPAKKNVRRVGAYAKLLANYFIDDAIIEAEEKAELLFVRGLAFCATSDSDGYITDSQLARFVGAGMRDVTKRAARLVQVGLWQQADGGYLVRSWTRIHETAEEKARHRKADRERKHIQTESERNPGGVQTEGVLDSLSLIHSTADTEQRHGTTEQLEEGLGGERSVTSPATRGTKPPTCPKHPDGNSDEPCRACAKVREWDQRTEQRIAKERAERIANCPDCGGGHWREDGTKCDHSRRSA